MPRCLVIVRPARQSVIFPDTFQAFPASNPVSGNGGNAETTEEEGYGNESGKGEENGKGKNGTGQEAEVYQAEDNEAQGRIHGRIQAADRLGIVKENVGRWCHI
jgi:hypothetical protein